jgi:hypothetical protein
MGISRARRAIVPLGAVLVMLGAATALAGSSAPPGSVHQASGKAGCYTSDGSSEAGAGTCQNIRGGDGSTTLAISPDGHFAYLVGYGDSGSGIPPVLSVFRRNSSNGTLKQLAGKSGCFSRDGSSEDGPNTCSKARDLDTGDATSIAISSDGRFLYVASQYEPGTKPIGGIAIFKRNLTTGTLRQLSGKAGCVSANGASQDGPNTCARARAVDFVSNLHLTPDQKFLYASDYGDPPKTGIAVFARGAHSGTLHQLKGMNGCITGNGTTMRSGTKKVCRSWPNVSDPWDVATPDNHFAYIPAATNGGGGVSLVQAFERNARGGLVPLKGKGGCVSDTGRSPAGPCVRGRGLLRPERAVLSRNGRFLYINSYGSPSASPVAVLNRNPKTGVLSQRSGKAACISADGRSGDGSTCRTGRALDDGYAGALSPDGRTLYFSENGSTPTNGALAIFRVSPATGAFSQLPGKLGCVTADGSSEKGANTCEVGRAIQGPYQVEIGRSGRTVYVSSYSDNGVALFYATP